MGSDEEFWRSMMPVLANEGKASKISLVTLATICYAASNCDCAPFDSEVRREVRSRFKRYGGLFVYLKGCNPLLVLDDFLDQMATRTGVFQVRYASAVDAGYFGNFDWLSRPDINARYAVALMKNSGVEFRTPWTEAVKAYWSIMGNPPRFLESAASLYASFQRSFNSQ
jgi:hypothetical protein